MSQRILNPGDRGSERPQALRDDLLSGGGVGAAPTSNQDDKEGVVVLLIEYQDKPPRWPFYLACHCFNFGTTFAALGFVAGMPSLATYSAGIALGGLAFIVRALMFGL